MMLVWVLDELDAIHPSVEVFLTPEAALAEVVAYHTRRAEQMRRPLPTITLEEYRITEDNGLNQYHILFDGKKRYHLRKATFYN